MITLAMTYQELAATKRRRFLLVFTIVVVVILAVVLYGVWDIVLRPWTIRELMEADGLRAGTTRDLEGTISGIFPLNSSRGPILGLELDGNRTCGHGSVFGEPTRTYRFGERFRTTLHFREFTFNGQKGVWAPEILCPFPWTAATTEASLDAFSYGSGAVLRVVDPQEDGWSALEFTYTDGSRLPSNLTVSLRAGLPFGDDPRTGRSFVFDSASNWIVLGGEEFQESRNFYRDHPEADRMDSLADSVSQGGNLRFLDQQGDGLVGTGDRIEVRLNSTGGEGRYMTFVLVLSDPATPLTPWAVKYLVHGPDGPIEWFF